MKQHFVLALILFCMCIFILPKKVNAQDQLLDSVSRGWVKKLLPAIGIDEQMSKRINYAKNLSVTLYFRPAYRITTAYKEGANGKMNLNKPSIPSSGSFFLRPVRLDIRGPIILNKLDFRLRTRAFPAITPNDLNQSNVINFSLDYAYINYHIGDKIEVMGGKSLRLYGGFEFDMVPFFIHQYNKFILAIENFFPMGIHVRYRFNKKQSIVVGAYQPNKARLQASNPAQTLFGAFNFKLNPGQDITRFPIGTGIYWDGSFLKGKLDAKWSVFMEHRVRKETNITAILGERLKTKNLTWWVDVTLAYIASDLSTLLSTGYGRKVAPTAQQGKANFNTRYVLRNIFYTVFSSRLDWSIGKHWTLVFTGQYEQADQLKKTLTANQPLLGNAFRRVFLTNFTLEYYPLTSQRLSLFISTQQENNFFSDKIKATAPTSINNTFVHTFLIGAIYPLPIF